MTVVTEAPGEKPIDSERIQRLYGNPDASDIPPSPQEQRRLARSERCSTEFGSQAAAALDLLAIVDLAWHETYTESEVPIEVLDDLFVASRGDLVNLIHMANLALTDWRDLRVNADHERSQ